jgi:branched-chain amino acid transport system substrate-binding protein
MVHIRRRGAVAAIMALTLAAAGCAETDNGDSGSTDSGPITMGAILDITGAGASLGVPERRALEMLTEQVNEAGGVDGREIELIVVDNKSAEDEAAKAMNEMISRNVDIVLGASRTGPSLAMRGAAEASQMPMISLAANVAIVDGAEWIFKTAQNDSVVLENIIDYAHANGWTTIGLLRDASGFGEGVGETLSELGEPLGISVVAEERFAPDATEFTAQMINLRNADADMNLIWGIPPAAALAQRAYRELGLEAPIMQSHGIGNQVFLDTAGSAADGLVAPLGRLLVAEQLPDSDPQKEILLSFLADYEQTYGETPSTFAGHAWDAFYLALEAFEAVGTDKQAVRDYLEQVSGFVGITGVYEMTPEDHSGLSKDALVFVTISDGQWQLVEIS